jgi:uncharacterized lipoprotein
MILRGLWITLLVALAGCGGDSALKCDKNVAYLQARETPRVKAPAGLDDLDVLREMPMPKASPQAPRPPEDRCLEHPPIVRVQ